MDFPDIMCIFYLDVTIILSRLNMIR